MIRRKRSHAFTMKAVLFFNTTLLFFMSLSSETTTTATAAAYSHSRHQNQHDNTAFILLTDKNKNHAVRRERIDNKVFDTRSRNRSGPKPQSLWQQLPVTPPRPPRQQRTTTPVSLSSSLGLHHAHRSSGSSGRNTALLMTTGTTDTDNSNSESGAPALSSYMERSRIERRDVYNYEKWVEHRSTERFIGNLIVMMTSSGVVIQLFRDLLFLSGIATFICIYNALLVTGYQDWSGGHHEAVHVFATTATTATTGSGLLAFPILKLPGEFFALTSPALALLLIFKTNTSYKRWDEARKNWGSIVNSSRTIMREGAAWIHQNKNLNDDQKQQLMERLEQAVWCFPRSLTRHLLSEEEDQNDFARDCRAKLRPDLAEDLIVARHKPNRALYELSCSINEFSSTMDERRCISMDHSVTVLCDAMGSNERIFTSPVPRFYTRHTARFLETWLLLMPLGLYAPYSGTWNHWGMIPASFVIGFFLLGIEHLGIQLEEPFSVLPQHAITANSIGKVATESVDWRKTDYERMLDAYYNGAGFQ